MILIPDYPKTGYMECLNWGEIVNRKSSFVRNALTAIALAGSSSAWAQDPTITLGQVGRILTPNGMTHSSSTSFDFKADFDGRTIRLFSSLLVVRLDQKTEDSTPPASIGASCGPNRVSSSLDADKYIEAILAKVLPEGVKEAPAVWMMGDRPTALASSVTTQGYSTAVVLFRKDSAVKFLRGLYESESYVDLLLYEVGGKVLSPAEWPIIRIQVNRLNSKSLSALAQTVSFCETMARR